MFSSLRSTIAQASAFLALAFPALLSAQTFPTATVIPVAGSPQLMATGDFNRDGKPDIAYMDAYQGGNLHILLGNGDGTFKTGQVISVPGDVGAVLDVADINGDGIPDLILGYYGFGGNTGHTQVPTSISVYLGNGDGTFQSLISSSANTYGSPSSIYYNMAVADFNGDGKPDLVYSDGYGYIYFMAGDGHGHLALPVSTPACSIIGDVFAVDLNKDGRPDIVAACNYSFATFINQGNATFAAPTSYPTNLYSTSQKTFAVGDINGDGYPDVLYGDDNEKLWVAYGQSGGTFAPPATIAATPNHYPVILGISNLTSDTRPRALLSSADGVSIALGTAVASSQLYAGTGPYSSQNVIADFNHDGFIDVAVPGDNSIVILFGKSDGTLAAAPSVQTNTGVGGLTILDANGDSIPDIILNFNLVYPGNGDGTFGAPIGNGNGYPFQLYSGDFDGNGRLGFYTYLGINHNNGNGSFTATSLQNIPDAAAPFPTTAAVVADFNTDGLADVAWSASLGGYANPSANGNAVYIADSAAGGSYTYTTLNFTEPVGPLGAGDFNHDGCPDLAVGAATQMEIFLGDCKGNFVQSAAYPTNTGATITGTVGGLLTSLEPSDIAVADFDGDGHLDILYTIPGSSLAKVLYGNGDGTFVAGNDLALPHSSLYVTTADLNSDGNPDLIFSGQNLATIYYGQKSRSFGTPTFLAAGFVSGKAVVADLNRDGNPDIVIPNLNYDGGDDSNDVGFTFTVFVNQLAPRVPPPATTTTTLTSSLNPSTYGQAVTFTATVSAPSGTPTGSITFSDGATQLGTVALNTAGSAQFTTSSLTANDLGTTLYHQIYATYVPTGSFNPSSGSLQQVVNGLPSVTNLVVTPGSGTTTTSFTLTATVASGTSASTKTPTGTVVFYTSAQTGITGNEIGYATLVNGVATLTTKGFLSGSDYVVGIYFGDTVYGSSDSNYFELTVVSLPTTTTVALSPNPSTYGQPVIFSAHVAPVTPTTTVPTGHVTFTFCRGATTVANLDASGNASFVSPVPNAIAEPVSSCTFTGTYSGDTVFNPSTSATDTYIVTPSPSTTAILSATPNPAYVSQLVSFTIQVTGVPSPTANPVTGQPLPPGITQATGTVNLYDGATLIGSGSILPGANGNQLVITTSTLAIGTHSITASYTGDPNLGGSVSPAVSEVINALPPPDFTFTGANITFKALHSATGALELSSINNFVGTIAVACVPPYPAGYTCSLQYPSVSLAAGESEVFTYTLRLTPLASVRSRNSIAFAAIFPLTFLSLVGLSRKRRKPLRTLLSLALLAMLTTALAACGSDEFILIATGTFPITFTGTGTSLGTSTPITHTVTLNATITP